MTSVAPFFFLPLFPVNQRWSCEIICLPRGGYCTSWDWLEPQVVWEFRQMKWCSWSLGLPASSSLHQSSDSVANLHLWAALLPVTIKQRKDSLEVGCFPLKRMHLSKWQQRWLVQSCDLSVWAPAALEALGSGCGSAATTSLRLSPARAHKSGSWQSWENGYAGTCGNLHPCLSLLIAKWKKIASDFFSPFASFAFNSSEINMTRSYIEIVSHISIGAENLFDSRDNAISAFI